MELDEIFYIKEKDWYKLQGWATLAYDEDKNEISGLMTAVPQEDGRILVSDVEILKQENTGSNTELDGDSVSAYMMKYGMKYNNPDMKFVWWHSHHTMGAFWSGTDIKEIEAWKNNSYSLALVINLKEEYLFRISFWKTHGLPMEKHIDTTLTIERQKPKIKITDSMKVAYEELCSSPVRTNVWTRKAQNYGISYYRGQSNLWNSHENEKELEIEEAYEDAVQEASGLQDDFISGTIQLKEWKKGVKKINKICKDRKLPFKMIDWKVNKNQLLNKLIETMPCELFDWDDNRLKDKIETMQWNNSFGGGWYGN